MAGPSANLLVCASGSIAIIKIVGRANFSLSAQFRTLVDTLRNRGAKRFILDLGECTNMDSTFLGVLAGLGLELSGGNEKPGAAALELCHPSARILDLLDNLGISQFFLRIDQSPVANAQFNPATSGMPEPSKAQLSQLCLEAHQTLMEVNPDNIPKFKEVTQFLSEEVKKSKP